ncbi:MAG TPA: YciI family protein [Candidatus Dormibacteraeota bacterium]|nr:YciI family protein [Candidatus Dormibacteraeota bacterium]
MENRHGARAATAAIVTVALLLVGAIATGVPARSQQNQQLPNGMKQYFIAFLVKGEKFDQTPPKEELHELMQKHLAYIRSQAAAGKYALAGPFLDNDRIRGMLMVNAASADEVREIVGGDPMVKSGRMAIEIHPIMMADLACVVAEYNKKNNDK